MISFDDRISGLLFSLNLFSHHLFCFIGNLLEDRFFLWIVDLRYVFRTCSDENQGDGQYLNHGGVVLENENTQYYCKYFTSSYHKRNNMLLELLYHPVYENLSRCGQERNHQKVMEDLWMPAFELKSICQLAWNCRIKGRNNCHPFVYMFEHLQRPGLILGFYHCLEIWKEPIGYQGNEQKS